jgi:glutathione S-transferase
LWHNTGVDPLDKLTLTIGNKNYSSWSLRPWLVLEHLGLPFREHVIPLYAPGSKLEITKVSPAGKVPVLQHGSRVIWDSLAICEYLAELVPGAKLWPEAADERAHARSISAEMHSGFGALRQGLSMNIRRRIERALTPDASADVQRVIEIWRRCRERHVAGGEFLFGTFGIADAMYAPVVFRFETYGVALEGAAAAYAKTMLALPAMQKWATQARAESWTIPQFEP